MPASIPVALLAAALFGAATPFSKLLLAEIDPFVLAGILYLGAGLALAPRALSRGIVGKIARLGGRNRLLVLGSMVAGGLLGPVLLLSGLRLAASASVSLWLNLELVWTALLGQVLFRDRMTGRSALAALGILAASLLLGLGAGATDLVGGLLVAAACLAWGFDNHFTALIDELEPADSTFLKGAAAGSVNLALGLWVLGAPLPSLPGLGAGALIGAFSYGLSIVLYISAAHGLGASRAQLFFSSSPLFGLALAALVLREALGPAQLGAAALMLLSYALLSTERHAHPHEHPALSHTHWHSHGEGHHLHVHEGLGLLERLFGHSHGHEHGAESHDHAHRPDIHHRHS